MYAASLVESGGGRDRWRVHRHRPGINCVRAGAPAAALADVAMTPVGWIAVGVVVAALLGLVLIASGRGGYGIAEDGNWDAISIDG